VSQSTRTLGYQVHKPSGQADVTLDGRDCYLGKHGTQESRSAYDRIIAEWLANGPHLSPRRDSGEGINGRSLT
jgi:hypothetical protein